MQSVYEKVVPVVAEKFPELPHPETIPLPVRDEIAQTGLFGDVTVQKYRWEQEYTSRTYVDLIGTLSKHIVLSTETRRQLLGGIESHIETKFGGRILKEYPSVLYPAHCIDDRKPFDGRNCLIPYEGDLTSFGGYAPEFSRVG